MPRISDRRRHERRSEILAAAETCFARLGFHRTTMRDVIDEVGLSAGCVYTHFASKQELVDAITAERHRADAQLLDELELGDDAGTALALVGRGFIGSLATPEGLLARRVGVQTWTEGLVDESIREHVLEGVRRPLARLTKLIRSGQRSGRVSKAAPPEVLARAFIALFHGLVLQKLWEPELDVALLERAFQALAPSLGVEPAESGRPARSQG